MKHSLQTTFVSLSMLTVAFLPANAASDHSNATAQCKAAISERLALSENADIKRDSIKTRSRSIKLNFRVRQTSGDVNAYCLTTSKGEVLKLDVAD